MKYFSEKQVKELLGQQRAMCQKDMENGKNNVFFSDSPKLKNGVIGKVYSSDKIEEIKSEAWRRGFNCSDSMSFFINLPITPIYLQPTCTYILKFRYIYNIKSISTKQSSGLKVVAPGCADFNKFNKINKMKVNDFSLIPAYENAKRAIEVAIVAKAQLTIFGRSAWGLMSLASSAEAITRDCGGVAVNVTVHRVMHGDNCIELIDNIFNRDYLNMAIVIGESDARRILSSIDRQPENNNSVSERIKRANSAVREVRFDPTPAIREYIALSYDKLHMNAGSIIAISTISRAIAALDGKEKVGIEHVAEAICYLPEMLTPDDLEQLKQIK